MELQGKKILIGVCGSIAAYKSLSLVRLCVKAGAEVRVILTRSAAAFVPPLSFATLSKNEVYTKYYNAETGLWHNHVELGLWADVFIIAPATAAQLARLATGMADNFMTAVYLSARCRTITAPAMDLDMWKHPATQRNVQQLKADGVQVLQPGSGELASGLHGEGRMPEPEELYNALKTYFQSAEYLKSNGEAYSSGSAAGWVSESALAANSEGEAEHENITEDRIAGSAIVNNGRGFKGAVALGGANRGEKEEPAPANYESAPLGDDDNTAAGNGANTGVINESNIGAGTVALHAENERRSNDAAGAAAVSVAIDSAGNYTAGTADELALGNNEKTDNTEKENTEDYAHSINDAADALSPQAAVSTAPLPFAGKKVLISAGPTVEPIDPVRYISNHSSGKMGYALAVCFKKLGAQVMLVSGPVQLPEPEGLTTIKVQRAVEMLDACTRAFPQADIAVMCAAVADYMPKEIKGQKIKKRDEEMELALVKTPDILAALGRQKQPGQLLVGFALETENHYDNAVKKLQRKNLDMVVLNHGLNPQIAFNADDNKVEIIDKQLKRLTFTQKLKAEVAMDICMAVLAMQNARG